MFLQTGSDINGVSRAQSKSRLESNRESTDGADRVPETLFVFCKLFAHMQVCVGGAGWTKLGSTFHPGRQPES